MRAVDTALYSRLSAELGTAGTLGALGCTGVHRQSAPQGTVEPYIVFNSQSGVDEYSFETKEARSLLYLVKVVDRGISGLRAAQIDERVEGLLNDKPLSMTGWTTLRLRRESDVEYIEVDSGITYQHYGALYRIDVRPA